MGCGPPSVGRFSCFGWTLFSEGLLSVSWLLSFCDFPDLSFSSSADA